MGASAAVLEDGFPLRGSRESISRCSSVKPAKIIFAARSVDLWRMPHPTRFGRRAEVHGVFSSGAPSGLTVPRALRSERRLRCSRVGGAGRIHFGKIALLTRQKPLPRSGAPQSTRPRVAVKHAIFFSRVLASSRGRRALEASSRRATRPLSRTGSSLPHHPRPSSDRKNRSSEA